ncbi:MAG: hypothetical protein KDC95_24065 [Planctomycetes bacterium]|nr:hypothetical protein [Planctomycetota bacterium]
MATTRKEQLERIVEELALDSFWSCEVCDPQSFCRMCNRCGGEFPHHMSGCQRKQAQADARELLALEKDPKALPPMLPLEVVGERTIGIKISEALFLVFAVAALTLPYVALIGNEFGWWNWRLK